MPETYRLINDVVEPPITLKIGEWSLVLDPKLYTVEMELEIEQFYLHETELLAPVELPKNRKLAEGELAGLVKAQREHVVEARTELLALCAKFLLPANPDWTIELLGQRLHNQVLAQILYFFDRYGHNGQIPATFRPESAPTTPKRTRRR